MVQNRPVYLWSGFEEQTRRIPELESLVNTYLAQILGSGFFSGAPELQKGAVGNVSLAVGFNMGVS